MDKYTKAVLTVIAVCLVIQTTKDIVFIKEANASQVHKIVICDMSGSNCVGTGHRNSEKQIGLGFFPNG